MGWMSEQAVPTPGADRFLIGIVAAAVLLIGVGIAAVLLVGRLPSSPPVDPSSPVGVVQAYVQALRAGDLERAYGYLSRSAQKSVPLDTYRQRFPHYYEPAATDQRLLIEPVTVGSDAAEVKVTISRFSARSDPFSASSSHRNVTVRLVKEDGVWRVNQPLEPYPLLY